MTHGRKAYAVPGRWAYASRYRATLVRAVTQWSQGTASRFSNKAHPGPKLCLNVATIKQRTTNQKKSGKEEEEEEDFIVATLKHS